MAELDDSILNNVKTALGLDPGYTIFDGDIVIYINAAFDTLNQIGVGPEDGYRINGADEKWAEYLPDPKMLNTVKSYMILRVRLLFDPPQMGYLVTAITEQIKQLEWRLNVAAEQLESKRLRETVVVQPTPISASPQVLTAENFPIYHNGV